MKAQIHSFPCRVNYCGVPCAGVTGYVRRSLRAWLSRGFVFGWLIAPSSPTTCSRSAVRYILDLPQSSPSPSTERSKASPTPEHSTRVFQVDRGGSNLLSPFPSRRRGYTLNPSRRSRLPVCLLSLSLSDPSLAGTPRSVANDGSSPVCLHRDPH